MCSPAALRSRLGAGERLSSAMRSGVHHQLGDPGSAAQITTFTFLRRDFGCKHLLPSRLIQLTGKRRGCARSGNFVMCSIFWLGVGYQAGSRRSSAARVVQSIFPHHSKTRCLHADRWFPLGLRHAFATCCQSPPVPGPLVSHGDGASKGTFMPGYRTARRHATTTHTENVASTHAHQVPVSSMRRTLS